MPLVGELHRVLVPGGRMFVSVPAYRWLWSRRDDIAQHQRRYTRAMLRKLVHSAGFEIEQLFGYQFFLLPLFAASRIASRICATRDTMHEDAPRPWLNSLLCAVNMFEVRVGRWLRPPIGTSLLLVARKSAARAHSPGVQ